MEGNENLPVRKEPSSQPEIKGPPEKKQKREEGAISTLRTNISKIAYSGIRQIQARKSDGGTFDQRISTLFARQHPLSQEKKTVSPTEIQNMTKRIQKWFEREGKDKILETLSSAQEIQKEQLTVSFDIELPQTKGNIDQSEMEIKETSLRKHRFYVIESVLYVEIQKTNWPFFNEIPREIRNIIKQMLDSNAQQRPKLPEIISILKAQQSSKQETKI